MKLQRLYLKAFGPFTDRVLDFGSGAQNLVVIYGANEAGKSATLRAISDLRFGIPDRSVDRFIHDYADMRVGGVFVDTQGHQYSLMRRKGRSGGPLTFHEFDDDRPADGRPATADVQRLLTGGLSKHDYDAMFGLSHERLREGGASLAKGEGDIGEALYEASAGVRSIKSVIEGLDQSARAFFMPGARGKNARINESLRLYETHQDAFRAALVRPQQWVELHRAHEAAKEELGRSEAQLANWRRQLLLITELRAVGPQLSTLEQARIVAAGLSDVILLPETCAADRVAAQTSLGTENVSADVAAADAQRHQGDLDRLRPDEAVLASAGAIRRLVAQAEAIEPLRAQLAGTVSDVATAQSELDALAALIHPGGSVDEVMPRAPAGVMKVEIEDALRAVEETAAAIERTREALVSLGVDSEEGAPARAPTSESRLALAAALKEAVRIDATLRRLDVLPTEILGARRAVTVALGAVGLADPEAVAQVRPLLDTEIATASSEVADAAGRLANARREADRYVESLRVEVDRREGFIADGAGATIADVRAARARRQDGWALVRDALGNPGVLTSEAAIAYGPGRTLAQAYEDAVEHADAVIDEVARDTTRATNYLACVNHIRQLEENLAASRALVAEIEEQAIQWKGVWSERLAAAGLPAVTPVELREWQGKLDVARVAVECLNARLDEEDLARRVEREVVDRLKAAVAATGISTALVDSTLRTLSTTAGDIEEQCKLFDAQAATALGKRQERSAQRSVLQFREEELQARLETARAELERFLDRLLLSKDASVAVVRSRLGEFDRLVAAAAACATARQAESRVREDLVAIERQADALARAVTGDRLADVRLYIDVLDGRLTEAQRIDSARAVAQQAHATALASERQHREKAARHQQVLQSLCEDAAVSTLAQLVQAEEFSQRKRQAQSELGRATSNLALASSRTEEELRVLLGENDSVQMDADEVRLGQEIHDLERAMPVIRAREESSRRAVEAIDSADTAAVAREGMESAGASVRANMMPWVRSRLAHALLVEALKRFRERAQGPMLTSASTLFRRMTGGEFVGLSSDDRDDRPVLMAQRQDGKQITLEAMSEGTLDQLYLALRLAAIELRRSSGTNLPVILDDVLMTSDDRRAVFMVQALADFAAQSQVIVFTHHRHLLDLARAAVPAEVLLTVTL